MKTIRMILICALLTGLLAACQSPQSFALLKAAPTVAGLKAAPTVALLKAATTAL